MGGGVCAGEQGGGGRWASLLRAGRAHVGRPEEGRARGGLGAGVCGEGKSWGRGQRRLLSKGCLGVSTPCGRLSEKPCF